MQGDLSTRLKNVADTLDRQFLGKSEVIRLLLISIIAREHTVLIGPPGTAKSALLRTLAALLDARYFEYLLTRSTDLAAAYAASGTAETETGNSEKVA